MMAVEPPASTSSPRRTSSSNGHGGGGEASGVTLTATVPMSARRTSLPFLATATTARLATDLSFNHLKLLYLISLYAVAANSTKQNERWIRHVPLFVLMFEGIVKGVFGFDYAPASIPLSFKGKTLRRWINVSREGKAAIDDLWELRLLHGIKLSSDDFQPVTAYQVSARGLDVVERIPSKLRAEVDAFIYPPVSFEKKLLQVSYDGTRFILRSGAYVKKSEVTESEDVSYVSSPFLPQCLRSKGFYHIDTRSNQHRALECATGSTTISKTTSEAITLGDVYALVGEWVPFGSNQIVALNERMGALDRCQGGILTSYVDSSPTDAQFEVPVGQTQVRILDFDFVRFINFEAESHFPETSGVVQVEHFGMHLNCDGSLIYGIKVEAILDRVRDKISIDHLARLLVDVHQDSSMLVNDLLSRYQLSLLNMLYLGDSFQRNKYNCIIATKIEPQVAAIEYLRNPSLANELAQVLGDIYACYDLSPQDILIVGKAGCLVCGPHVFRFEHVLTKYVGLVCRDMFIKNFFARTFVLDATLKDIRQLIHVVHREPAVALQVREKLAVASKDTILLAETLEYLLDSLEDLQLTTVCSDRSFLSGQSDADVEAKLMQVLALQQLRAQTIMRCHDSIKLMENTMLQLEQLQMIAESTATNQLEMACQRVHLNTRELINALATQQSTKLTLEATQFIVSGLFVFDVIDRLTGATFHVHVPQWALDYIVDPVMSKPFLWFVINVIVYALALWLVSVLAGVVHRAPLGWCAVKAELNQRINLSALETLLARNTVQGVVTTEIGATSGSPGARFRVVNWVETDCKAWANASPQVEFLYDEKHAFALFVTIRFDAKASSLREEECLQKFKDLLARYEVLEAASDHKSAWLKIRKGTVYQSDLEERTIAMVLKQLMLTARDAWMRRSLPAQVRARDTRIAFTEILGEESLKGHMLPAGPIMELMDVLAGAISVRVAQSPVATISFDRVDLVRPVFHGDLVRIEGEVISTGSSSMAIQICGFRHDLQTNKYQHTHSGIVTMVAIDRFGKSRKGVPQLFDPDRETYCESMRDTAKQRLDLAARWRKVQEDVDKMDHISASDIHSVEGKSHFVTVQDTELELRKWFLPKNLNVNNTLFGGDLLTWMDKAALYCARTYTSNERMVTIAMNRVLFKLPILATDVVTLKARVCNVRRYRLEVEVEVFVTAMGETTSRKSHTGYFTVMNMDVGNHLKEITTGLTVDESDQASMKILLKAEKRWAFEDEDSALMRLEPLTLSLHNRSTEAHASIHPGIHNPISSSRPKHKKNATPHLVHALRGEKE